MEFGIIANIGPFATADGARAMAKGAEDAGFESLWTVEHVLVPQGYESEYPYDPSGKMPGPDDMPLPDPLVWLTYVAAVTSSVKLGTGILILPQRNPGVVAKEIATLDQLSGGRVLLGVGAGWLEEEFQALGIPFEERGRRTDDHIGALRALWSDGATTFEGEFTSYTEVHSTPKPVDGTVPVIIGGHSKTAARRAGRFGDGFFPGRGDNDQLADLIAVMRQAATDAGRDPDAIEVTTFGQAAFAPDPQAALQEQESLGISRVVIPPLAFDVDGIGPALATFGENVISKAG